MIAVLKRTIDKAPTIPSDNATLLPIAVITTVVRTASTTRDTVYIFWTVVVGLTCGVGDYITAGIGSAIVFLILLVLGRIKNESRMLLIVRGARSTDKRIMSVVSEYFSRRIDLRVENTTEQTVELIYEILIFVPNLWLPVHPGLYLLLKDILYVDVFCIFSLPVLSESKTYRLL